MDQQRGALEAALALVSGADGGAYGGGNIRAPVEHMLQEEQHNHVPVDHAYRLHCSDHSSCGGSPAGGGPVVIRGQAAEDVGGADDPG